MAFENWISTATKTHSKYLALIVFAQRTRLCYALFASCFFLEMQVVYGQEYYRLLRKNVVREEEGRKCQLRQREENTIWVYDTIIKRKIFNAILFWQFSRREDIVTIVAFMRLLVKIVNEPFLCDWYTQTCAACTLVVHARRMGCASLQASILNIVDRIGLLELKRLKIIVTFPLFCGSST